MTKFHLLFTTAYSIILLILWLIIKFKYAEIIGWGWINIFITILHEAAIKLRTNTKFLGISNMRE